MLAMIQRVKVLALDVDGVLTDGKIIIDSEGRESKEFDVQDGLGMVLMRRAGFRLAIISARASTVVAHRANDLNVDKVYTGVFPKISAYEDMLKHFQVSDAEVCFVGDDLADLPLFKRVGFSVGVANAVEEIKDRAHYVTRRKGGEGAVREVIELILKTQGKWDAILQEM